MILLISITILFPYNFKLFFLGWSFFFVFFFFSRNG